MTKPLVSIVIPTRERSATLGTTLQTALDQSTDNYEIVVSDNFSQDDTRAVIDQVNDGRIRYVNPGRRLSMSDNYEYALQHANGSYVVFIGDDDGVMPDAVRMISDFYSKEPSPVYFWQTHMYRWPMAGKGGQVDYIAPTTAPRKMDLRRLARFSISWGTWRYYALPCVYHSAVSTSLLNQVRLRTGRVFHSTNPDVFMAFALPVFSDYAIDVGVALTVNGISERSNGGSYVIRDGSTIVDTFIREYGDYALHRSLYPSVSFRMNMIPDSALVAMDLFPEFYSGIKFNYSAMWAFMQRSPTRDSQFSVIAEQTKIKRHHHFSVSQYLFCTAVHKILALRRSILRKRVASRFGAGPADVGTLVRLLATDDKAH